jgi:pilus assembly protein CpaB
MKAARLAVLGVALAAGIGAAIIATSSKPPEVVVTQAPPPPTDKVLVAAKELNFGDVIDEAGMRWEDWPKDNIPEGFIRQSASPGGINELKDAIVRANFAAGEPLRRERLVKGSGFLATVLAPGKRAVAINIDTQGSSTAGGFILPPNDRVDVIHIFRDEEAARKGNGNSFVSRTILTDIRVLAIGQNVQEKNGERVITGANATLELTPSQAETIVAAQRTGQLSLTLRGMTDVKASGEQYPNGSHELVVVRNGVVMQDGAR